MLHFYSNWKFPFAQFNTFVNTISIIGVMIQQILITVNLTLFWNTRVYLDCKNVLDHVRKTF